MQWGFLLVVAAWVIIGVVGNKKKQQARQEAAKQAEAARQGTAQARPAQTPPQSAAPYSPYYPETPRPVQQPARPVVQPVRPARPAARPQQPAAARPAVQAAMQEGPTARAQAAPTSRLTQIQQTQRHTLTPSSESKGHVHEETSLTGFEADCPPAAAEQLAPAPAGIPTFSWKPDAVLNGMVYAEILAKPKALR